MGSGTKFSRTRYIMSLQVKDIEKKAITKLNASRRKGYSLQGDYYSSPEIHERDLDIFFRRHWIYVGLDIDIPEPGDVFKVDIGLSSILLVRDDDGKARAFHNVCRHRGSRIIDVEKSSVGALVCPYHNWTYELTGELTYAAHMGERIDRCALGLKPVSLRGIGGMLFVCLSAQPPQDMEYVASALEPRLGPYDLRETKIAHEVDIIENGNWKLAVDNNRECYHCSGSHPELANSLNALDIGFDPSELTPQQLADYELHRERCDVEVANWESQGAPSSRIEYMSDCATLFRTERFVIKGAGESHTLDARVASSKLLGTVPSKRFGDMHLWTHNSWSHFFSDHAVTSYIIPLSPRSTLVRTRWLVHKDAVEGVDYDLTRLTAVWKATNQQDAELVARAQTGVESPEYSPGPFSEFTERYVDLNVQWSLDRLMAHGY
jgi:glycine betaine catabolism A